MAILAIETTGPHCSVAILDNEGGLHQKTGTQVMNHLRILTPMIRDLMDQCGITWTDLEHIAVSVGPGSFTGIRIGVSTGRALNQITGIPLIAVETLAAFGRQEGEDGGTMVCPLLDARRSQVYAGAYRFGQTVISGGPYMLDEFLEMLEEEDDLRFVGDGVSAYEDRICSWARERGKKFRCTHVVQQASGVALLARDMIRAGEATALSWETLLPNYMRIPEAERKLKEKKAAGEVPK